MYGTGNVLQRLFAGVIERGVEPILHILMNAPRNGDPTGLRDFLKARSDIHPIAVDILAFNDDVSQIDADAERDALVFIDPVIAFSHTLLNFNYALCGIYHGRKFQQQAIAHGLDDAPAMFRNPGIDQFRPMSA